jgi:tetratricopeptide (TPR) repeat protein
LRSGREEIETAVLLDPNKALLRSYMGKAYYEEKRDELALEQLSMAKALDANDPTAWYYESILLQSVNRPVEALQAQRKAIELNDNRGVYRSRQLLDQDEAARTASLGRIYNDLNFEQQARLQATNALLSDPASHSAHRLLADSYTGIAYLDAARQSELLQSKLTQPLNLDPLQPQLSNANLGLLDGNGPGDLSYNEYNPLFVRNGLALQVDALRTKDKTWADDIILAGLRDDLAFSVGQYHQETDLVGAEVGYKQDMVNGFLQYQIGANSAIQLEVARSEEDKGDVRQRLLPDFLSIGNLRVDNETTSVRLGFNGSLSDENKLLLSAIRRDVDFGSTEDITGFGSILQSGDREISLYESQVTGKGDMFAWLAGVGYQAEELDDVFEVTCASPFCVPWRDVGRKDLYQTKLYGYLTYRLSDAFSLTGGLTSVYEKVKAVSGESELRRSYPKFGFQWMPAAGHEVRFAAFRNRVSVMPTSLYETLEPTHVVGFNQLYDDQKTTDSENYGVAYSLELTDDLHTGVSALSRRLSTDVTVIDTLTNLSSLQRLDYDDRYASLWLNWAMFRQWALGVDYTYNHFSLEESVRAGDSNILAPDGVLDLSTHELSTSLRYFHPRGFVGSVVATYYDQDGEFIDRSGLARQHGEDRGAIIDLVASYRFPKRIGSVSIGVHNLFDNDLDYEDRNNVDVNASMYRSSPSSFSSERLLFAEVSFVFR